MEDVGVPRANVLRVLKDHGVTVVDSKDGAVTISSADVPPETHLLPDVLQRRMIQRIARRFSIEPHLFWHLEYLGDEPQVH